MFIQSTIQQCLSKHRLFTNKITEIKIEDNVLLPVQEFNLYQKPKVVQKNIIYCPTCDFWCALFYFNDFSANLSEKYTLF